MATLTACRPVNPTSSTPLQPLGDITERLHHLNPVYVVPPRETDTIKTRDHLLFAQLDCWDCSKKITLEFRSNAMLQFAALGTEEAPEYEESLARNALRHPLMASLHLQIRTKRPASDATATEHHPCDASATEPSQAHHDNIFSSAVVEAIPCTFRDIPNNSVEAMHGLLAGRPQTSERLATVALDKLKQSPFYKMLANGELAEKPKGPTFAQIVNVVHRN
eukprot:12408694-Karenia_brevis.AAC.1